MLALTAAVGGTVWALLSHVPGKRGGTLLTGVLLVLGAPTLFLGLLCLSARTVSLRAVLDRFFLDRLSKLLGCVLFLLLVCVLGLAACFLRAGGPRPFFRRACASPLHRRTGAVLGGCLLGLLLGCGLLAGDPPDSPLRLSELCCANFTLLSDPDTGAYGDYLELLNTGDEPVELEGYFLSDNGKKRNRFRLPARTLAPGETLLLWADGTGRSGQQSGADIHLNFSLRPGDTVWFSSPSGVLLERVEVPARRKNIALTLLDGEWVLARGTPGKDNAEAERYTPPTLAAPVLSLPSGFYDEPQSLALSAAPGCEIRYTLDGSLPTAESPLYEGPLTLRDISGEPNRVVSQTNTTIARDGAITEPVDKGTVLRAAAFDGAGHFSETVTAVYFVGKERFAKYAGRQLLSIVAEPASLFGEYGICVTGGAYDRWLESGGEGQAPWPCFYARGSASERDAEIALWDGDRRLVLEEACGLRVQGDSSRADPFKRFRLIAREFYGGSDTFSAPIFGDSPSHSFFTREGSTDLIAHLLVSERGLGGLAARAVTVFVNGEFYQDSFLRERYDRQYFENHYGVKQEDLILIGEGKLEEGLPQDLEDYQTLMDFIRQSDCSDPAVYAEICRQIDVENYAAFLAANLYLNNSDWSVYKDYKLWRSRSGGGSGPLDGRWRWLIYDMDACYWTRSFFGDAPRPAYDMFRYPAPYTKASFLELPVFRELLRSPAFRALFSRTWLEMMNADFSADRACGILQSWRDTRSFWLEFLTERPGYAPQLLIDALSLSGEPCGLRLELSDPAGGTLRMGPTALYPDRGLWTGTWVTGVPLTLEAVPAEGWRFAGWTGSVESSGKALALTPDSDIVLTAIFERK